MRSRKQTRNISQSTELIANFFGENGADETYCAMPMHYFNHKWTIACVISWGCRRHGYDASVASLGAHVGLAAQGRRRRRLPRAIRRGRRRLRCRRSVGQPTNPVCSNEIGNQSLDIVNFRIYQVTHQVVDDLLLPICYHLSNIQGTAFTNDQNVASK